MATSQEAMQDTLNPPGDFNQMDEKQEMFFYNLAYLERWLKWVGENQTLENTVPEVAETALNLMFNYFDPDSTPRHTAYGVDLLELGRRTREAILNSDLDRAQYMAFNKKDMLDFIEMLDKEIEYVESNGEISIRRMKGSGIPFVRAFGQDFFRTTNFPPISARRAAARTPAPEEALG